MPRANSGPRLVTLRQKGWNVARFYIRYSGKAEIDPGSICVRVLGRHEELG